ncbi:MAG: ABC-2 family transporter protein [Ruminococcus sp.]|jgi:ABC-2 type transport system permease protein|nr:ABC-2 family transporter protein [Ruminococcus sp.]
MRYIKLHRIFIAQYLKKLMEYKADFTLGAIGLLIAQAFQILFLGIIFSQIPSLRGWQFEQILFIYGFSLISKSLDHLFTDNLWMVGYRIVRKGEFDKYLTRPINTLYHVIAENFCVDAFGEVLSCVLLLGYSIPRLSMPFYWYTIPLWIVSAVFATLIYTSLKIMTAAISFWTKSSGHITHMLYMVNDFSKYPVSIYNRFVQTVITYILPFAFTAYYPASYFLTGENPLFCVGGTVVAGSVLFALAIFVWNKGIGAYESAGS